MKGHGMAACGLGLLALTGTVSAQPKPRRIDFTVTFATTGGGASVSHVLKASCDMFEGEPGLAGLDGAPKAATAGGAMGDVQAATAKCGSDAACVQAAMLKMMQNGTVTKAAAQLNQKNYTLWTPTTCTGTVVVDDRSSRKGMDAMAAFAETVTTKGTAEVRPWQGLAIQHDLHKGVSEYRFTSPEAVMIDRTLVRTGDGAATEKTKERVAAFGPRIAHTQPGSPTSGKAVQPIAGGSVTVEWTVAR